MDLGLKDKLFFVWHLQQDLEGIATEMARRRKGYDLHRRTV
ncbi:MAG: hypothetical protein ACLVBJ_04085 [Pilosibacter sp.]